MVKFNYWRQFFNPWSSFDNGKSYNIIIKLGIDYNLPSAMTPSSDFIKILIYFAIMNIFNILVRRLLFINSDIDYQFYIFMMLQSPCRCSHYCEYT